jgi:hypothetical protein
MLICQRSGVVISHQSAIIYYKVGFNTYNPQNDVNASNGDLCELYTETRDWLVNGPGVYDPGSTHDPTQGIVGLMPLPVAEGAVLDRNVFPFIPVATISPRYTHNVYDLPSRKDCEVIRVARVVLDIGSWVTIEHRAAHFQYNPQDRSVDPVALLADCVFHWPRLGKGRRCYLVAAYPTTSKMEGFRHDVANGITRPGPDIGEKSELRATECSALLGLVRFLGSMPADKPFHDREER